MRLLLDTCVAGPVLIPILAHAGHDVIWSGHWEKDPGDAAILAYAYRERRVLITLDKDFGALAILHGEPHAGIVRLVNLSTKEQAQVCLLLFAEHAAELEAGAIITAERTRLRIRLP
mgnify:CR=1 FL=1